MLQQSPCFHLHSIGPPPPLVRLAYQSLTPYTCTCYLVCSTYDVMNKSCLLLDFVITLSDIVSQTGVSYFAKHGEEPMTHHPTKGMDGDAASCFFSGYHTATWWRVTFGRDRGIRGIDVYGRVIYICTIALV